MQPPSKLVRPAGHPEDLASAPYHGAGFRSCQMKENDDYTTGATNSFSFEIS